MFLGFPRGAVVEDRSIPRCLKSGLYKIALLSPVMSPEESNPFRILLVLLPITTPFRELSLPCKITANNCSLSGAVLNCDFNSHNLHNEHIITPLLQMRKLTQDNMPKVMDRVNGGLGLKISIFSI